MTLAEILQTAPLFAVLSDADRDILARTMVVTKAQDGHVFMHEGVSPGWTQSALHVILKGRVLVTVAGTGDDEFGVVRLMDPGEVFGIVALVSDGPRTATCRAAGPTTVATMGREAFELLYRSDMGVASRFQLALARQLARDLRSSDAQLRTAYESGEIASVAGKVVRL